ncbi:DsrE family protein [Acidiferrobacter sp.]|uniref:DsrE family protein n=1 Tax=Acidiferrobacter sp. TaxID=1872107 RepID=UPI00261158A8|nr:DsrE family protein [Acidiferrobacter sp.]
MADNKVLDLVIILITGRENPQRLPSAFFLAAAAAAAEQDVLIYFTGPATELLKKGVAETLFPLAGGKSVAGFMKLAEDNGVRMIGCAQSLELNHMTAADLSREMPLLTPSAALPSLGTARRVLTW